MNDDEDKSNYEIARRQLHDTENELRKLHGEKPKEFKIAEPPYCSFCGQGKNQVEVMIDGPSVYICNECVELCRKIIEDKRKRKLIMHLTNREATPIVSIH